MEVEKKNVDKMGLALCDKRPWDRVICAHLCATLMATTPPLSLSRHQFYCPCARSCPTMVATTGTWPPRMDDALRCERCRWCAAHADSDSKGSPDGGGMQGGMKARQPRPVPTSISNQNAVNLQEEVSGRNFPALGRRSTRHKIFDDKADLWSLTARVGILFGMR